MPINVAWSPQPGSQTLFLMCPAPEAIYEGTRGPGKTDALLMDFAQHVGKGFGADWRGILFRASFPQLQEVITKSKKWFKSKGMFPNATYIDGKYKWVFPGGEELYFRYMRTAEDYWNYHGHEYPWIGWEELTNWPDNSCYESMKACWRSSNADCPRKYRATANPYGVGHAWVKQYFVDPAPAGKVVYNDQGLARVRIHGDLSENKILNVADPEYVARLEGITDPNLRKAWLSGSWDIVAGGALTDVWYPEIQVVSPFQIPVGWRRDRSFDWGSSKPFSVGWWAESDGTIYLDGEGKKRRVPPGTLFRTAEFYGWNGKANEGSRMLTSDIAKEIRQAEMRMESVVLRSSLDRKILKPIASKTAVIKAGPADPSIWESREGSSIAGKFRAQGIKWTRGDNSPGSRVAGLDEIRERLRATIQQPMEFPGLFIFNTCRHFLRTVPNLPRDEKKMDDVDTNAEDHVYDETRYRVNTRKRITTSQSV